MLRYPQHYAVPDNFSLFTAVPDDPRGHASSVQPFAMTHQSHRLPILAVLMLMSFSPLGHVQPAAPLPCFTEQGVLSRALDRETLTPRFLPADQVSSDDAPAESPEDILNGVPASAASAASDASAAPAAAVAPVNANAWPVQAPARAQPAAKDAVAAAPAHDNDLDAFLQDATCLRAAAAPKPSLAEKNFKYALHGPLFTNNGNRLPSLRVQRSTVPGEGSVGMLLLDDPSWKFNVGVNNAGMYSSGRMQSTAGLFFNSPLGMDGTLNTTLSQDLQNSRYDATNRALSTNYTLPWGSNWTFGVAGTTNVSSQQNTDVSDATHGVEWRINRVLDRSYGTETGLQFRVSRSLSEDSNQQRSDNTVTQIGLTHRRYLGIARLDFTLMQQVSAPGLGQQAGAPSWSYRIRSFDANLSVPF